MKKCSYCSGEIADEAVKCDHCGGELAAQDVLSEPSNQTDSSPKSKVIGIEMECCRKLFGRNRTPTKISFADTFMTVNKKQINYNEITDVSVKTKLNLSSIWIWICGVIITVILFMNSQILLGIISLLIDVIGFFFLIDRKVFIATTAKTYHIRFTKDNDFEEKLLSCIDIMRK